MAAQQPQDKTAKPGTAVVNIRAELAKDAEAIASRIQAPTGEWIRVTQDKKFVLPDGTKNGGPLTVVIIDFTSSNQWRETEFAKGQEAPPSCYALGLEPDNLVASDKSPVKQSENCAECPKNQWGTGKNGKGKACANLRILAVVENSDDPNAKIMRLKVSPTAIKAFDAYVRTIKTQFNATPLAVVTDIYFDPNLDYGSLRFGNPKPNKNLEVHFARRQDAKELLAVEPDVSGYKPPAPPVVVKPAAKGKK